MSTRKCPNCGTSEDWFETDPETGEEFCGNCFQVVDSSRFAPVADCSSWIVGSPAPHKPRDPQAQMEEEGRRLAARLDAIMEANNGKMPPPPPRPITDDSLYTG